MEFLVALQKVLNVFSCSVISHVSSSVGPMHVTKYGGIAEIAYDELSHNIFSLYYMEVFPDTLVPRFWFCCWNGEWTQHTYR